jgi:hypothetical protein
MRLRGLLPIIALIAGLGAAGSAAAGEERNTISEGWIAQPNAIVSTFYVSPKGDGLQSGASFTHAMPMREAIVLMRQAGTRILRLRLAPGEYDFSEDGGLKLFPMGGRQGPLIIEGSGPETVFVGGYRPGGKRGAPLFTLGRSRVAFKNLAARNFGAFIDLPSGRTIDDIEVSGVSISEMFDGIVLDRGENVTARDWLIEDVTISGYHRVGIRLAGDDTSGFRIRRATIDGRSAGRKNHCFKGGIQLLAGVRNVTIEDVTVRDNVGCEQSYQQGDGIEADDKQGAPDNIVLRNVTAEANRDGNFDLKATNMVLENLVSRNGGVSRFGFRFWNYDYLCRNCVGDGAQRGDVGVVSAVATFMVPAGASARLSRHCSERTDGKPEGLIVMAEGAAPEERGCRNMEKRGAAVR